MRRQPFLPVPLVPTLVVGLAVALMIGLGLWQLRRLDHKQMLLARYAAALTDPTPVAFPPEGAGEAVLYRRARFVCRVIPGLWDSVAGRNARGEGGYVHIAHCQASRGEASGERPALVQIGWTRDPHPPQWDGGPVSGTIAPFHHLTRLVVDPPQAGLEPSARPDPSEIPNNHLAYAVQWFLFAGIAVVIYALALWRRGRHDVAKGDAAEVVTPAPGR